MCGIMWPVLVHLARTYSPALVFPFAFVIGAVGYKMEGWISDRHTPWQERPALQRRLEREEQEFVVPETIFDRNKKKE